MNERPATGQDIEVTDATLATDAQPTPRKIDKGLLLASFAIACGLVLVAFGFVVATTGDDGIDRPDTIESLQPVENAIQVLQQERIVVNLEAGYEARLVIDGVEIPTTLLGQLDVDPNQSATPGEQIDLPLTAVYDPGNAVISYQPVEGAPVEQLTQGEHSVTVIYWRTEDGPENAQSYVWSFTVI